MHRDPMAYTRQPGAMGICSVQPARPLWASQWLLPCTQQQKAAKRNVFAPCRSAQMKAGLCAQLLTASGAYSYMPHP